MSHLHEASGDSTRFHRAILHLYAAIPILSLRVFRFGGELSLRPVIGPPMRRLIDWFARHVESGQVVTFAEVEQLVREAESCSIGECPCLRIYRDDDCGHGTQKCVRLNAAHDVFTARSPDRHVSMEKDELLERLRTLSADQGLYHSKIFLAGQQVYAICSCCDNCIAYAMLTRYGQPNALKKGRQISRVDADRCVDCGACTSVCRFGAMESGRVDESSCFGCGLCALKCPQSAVAMVLRDGTGAEAAHPQVYDAAAGS
ncbi:MAG: 4Fe-4S binding protein [Armatimonadota bacterium]